MTVIGPNSDPNAEAAGDFAFGGGLMRQLARANRAAPSAEAMSLGELAFIEQLRAIATHPAARTGR